MSVDTSTSTSTSTSTAMRVAVFGHGGWIGGMVCAALEEAGHTVLCPDAAMVRADDAAAVGAYLDTGVYQGHSPTHVFSAIGRTHGPGFTTIDYLEQPGKLVENVRDNLFAPVVLALACKARGIHFTYLGTGCIFNSVTESEGADAMDAIDAPDGPIRGSEGYDEAAAPDFTGSAYSTVKGFTDGLFHAPGLREGVLNLRIRMPITADANARNFITKILNYRQVCSVPNSMSVLPTLLPAVVRLMAARRATTLNLTNPGVISHDEILEMYRDIIDPVFTWCNFTLAEQDRVLACKRSNNKLCTALLERECPEVPPIHEAVRSCLEAMALAPVASR
jgi:3,5-epimerase/4-reductase